MKTFSHKTFAKKKMLGNTSKKKIMAKNMLAKDNIICLFFLLVKNTKKSLNKQINSVYNIHKRIDQIPYYSLQQNDEDVRCSDACQ